MLGPRKDFLDWDDVWMAKALLVAQRSKDPRFFLDARKYEACFNISNEE